MLGKWLRAGLAARRITTSYPQGAAQLRRAHETWQNVVTMIAPCEAKRMNGIDLCPTGAVYSPDDRTVQLDAGACIGCGRCVAALPDVFAWTDQIDLAVCQRQELVQLSTGGEGQ